MKPFSNMLETYFKCRIQKDIAIVKNMGSGSVNKNIAQHPLYSA
jgi:hypothetical protein